MQLRGLVVAFAAGALAVAAGLWAWSLRPLEPGASGAPPAVAAAGGSLEAQIEALRAELAAERDARLGLSAEVEMLRVLLEDGAAGPSLAAPAAPAAAAGASAAAEAGGAAGETAAAASPEARPGFAADEIDRSWFDAEGLLESGVSAADVARLQTFFEESALESLELRDRATREGWVESPRFVQATVAQRMATRSQLGDEAFDQFLYATHRTNRVRARSVLPNGAAARAGLRPGDVILRYDGKSVFGARELQGATTQGEAGRTVTLDVLTGNGVVRRLSLPSGPLGVQLAEERLRPQTNRE
jgi:hypothetical protein